MSSRRGYLNYTFLLCVLFFVCLIVPGLINLWRQAPAAMEKDLPPAPSTGGLFLDGPRAWLHHPSTTAESTPSPARATVTSHADGQSPRSFRVEAPVRIDSGGTQAAAEVSVVAEGNEVVAAWIDLRDGNDRARVAVAVSQDAGITWTDQLLQPTGNPQSDDLHGDPMTAHDPRTGQLWAGGLAFFDQSLFVARHLTSTGNFTPPVTFGTSMVVDKPWLAAGPPPDDPNATRLYAIDAVGTLWVSDDLGISWNASGSTQNGVGHLPRVGPDGSVYVAYRGGQDSACLLQRSDDGGQTFAPATTLGIFSPLFLEPAIPGQFRAPALCILAVDPTDGALNLAVAGLTGSSPNGPSVGDADILFIRSEDRGATWTPPRIISGGPSPSDQFLPWLEVDPAGRLHLVYLDTRRTPQTDDDRNAWLDVYYSTSSDDGQSWTEVPLTPQPFDSGPTAWINGIPQFVGDYLGLAVNLDQAVVGYAATFRGDLDIYAQRIVFGDSEVFGDGFESGDTAQWSSQPP